MKAGRIAACVLATGAVLAAASAPASAEVVWAVGDGGVPEATDDALAAYIAGAGAFDRFLYLGDVYETGTAEEFAQNYHTSFGRFKEKSSPTPGNHEWGNRAIGYDPYWGALAPQNGGGHWYSFNVGGWHIVSLNTEEPLDASSAQMAWLKSDLALYPGTCTIAFTHKPRFSATPGVPADRTQFKELWDELSGRAVALLSGHDHNYERFKPVDGLVQLIAGTGGRFRYNLDEADPRLDAGTDQHFGALRLQLARGSAAFEFRATDGAVLDSGSLACTPHASEDPPPPGDPPPSTQPPPGDPQPSPQPPPADDRRPPPDVVGGPPQPPDVSITSPKHGAVHSRRLRLLRGAVARATGPVSITLVRRGRRCARFDGRRFVAASCRTRAGVPVGGSSQWALSLPARLAPGRYRLTARVTGAGDATRLAGVTFTIR